MCGIFGYIGKKNAVSTTIEGLKKLEYRGYDSSGIAGINQGKILFCKEVGKISVLQDLVAQQNLSLEVAIAQTRWATHGKPSKANAHPHFDEEFSIAVVHNGIIENHEALRKALKEKGKVFTSETDTEIIAHLIADFYEGDLIKALRQALPLLKGAYSIALIHRDAPDQIVAIAHESPLVIGIGEQEIFISSDSNAFGNHTQKAIFLSDKEMAIVKQNSVQIFNSAFSLIKKDPEILPHLSTSTFKGDFEHFTLKEIFEQPQTIRNAFKGRLLEEFGTAVFEGCNLDSHDLLNVKKILILACGTSWHAGLIGANMLESLAKIPVQVEISSEFRYKNPVISPGTLVIAISQSGETADTIAAIREMKAKAISTLAICNVPGSTLSREANSCLYLQAGSEIGVCSTKAFTSQLVVLALFTLLMARKQHMNQIDGQNFLRGIEKLPEQVEQVLKCSSYIQLLAKKYAPYENFFFLGRNYMYPTALEGALKLKEIAYVNANGYPAGELKHGPIALICETCPTIALCSHKKTYDKMLSNLMEIKARNGLILAIAEEGLEGLEGIADDIVYVPRNIDELAAIPATIVTQLLAYYIAKERGAEIDQPRNLAKSVTVE